MKLYVVYGLYVTGMTSKTILVGVYDSEAEANFEAQNYWLEHNSYGLQLVVEPAELNKTVRPTCGKYVYL
jgi:hypothetical protein